MTPDREQLLDELARCFAAAALDRLLTEDTTRLQLEEVKPEPRAAVPQSERRP